MQFADVCLQRARVYEVYRYPQSPGKGGWPTIRYFNAETGQAGKPYTQLHSDMSICTYVEPHPLLARVRSPPAPSPSPPALFAPPPSAPPHSGTVRGS